MSLSNTGWSLLHGLRDEPWLTVDQLAGWSGVSVPRVYAHLKRMHTCGFVQRLNPRPATIDLRAVYALTDRGVRRLAEHANTDERLYRRRYQLTRTRHVEILWQLERVCDVRDFLLKLPAPEFRVLRPHTLLHTQVRYHGTEKQIVLHGAGVLTDANGRGAPFVVEWDAQRSPPDRIRLQRLSEWLAQWIAYGPQRNVPTLLFVSADAEREQMLHDRLCASGQAPGWSLEALRTTTEARLRAQGPNAPLWWEPFQKERVTWHTNSLWLPLERCGFPRVVSVANSKIGEFGKEPKSPNQTAPSAQLLHWKLALSPQAKRVLLQVAQRPLLTIGQVAWLSGEHSDRVGKALQELECAGLVRGIWHAHTHRYHLTRSGIRYETAEMGYGRAVKQYWKRGGGRSGIHRLPFHLEHTIATNDFFLLWLRAAQEHKVRFEWIHEMASARFFYYGTKWHRLLPDGGGVWHGSPAPYRFLVEIDRSRESAQNLAAKFELYRDWRYWRSVHTGETEPHLLVVTTGWTQAEVILETMRKVFGINDAPYAMWVTTFTELERCGLEQSGWRASRQPDGLYYLPCFSPQVRRAQAGIG